MYNQESGNACRWRPWRRLPCKKITCSRETESRAVHQCRRENMRLLQCRHLFPQRYGVAAERIERRSREVPAVVDGVDSRKGMPLRKNVVDTRCPKILPNRLQGTAEHFGDTAIDRSGAGARSSKVKVARSRRGPYIQ